MARRLFLGRGLLVDDAVEICTDVGPVVEGEGVGRDGDVDLSFVVEELD